MIEMQSSEFDNEKPVTSNKQVSAVISYLDIYIIIYRYILTMIQF